MISTEAFPLRWVNEGSAAYLKIRFVDKDHAPRAPQQVVYDVMCMTTGTKILDNFEFPTPEEEIDIVISSSINAIINPANRYEVRRITVRAFFGGLESHNEQFDYRVKNLSEIL